MLKNFFARPAEEKSSNRSLYVSVDHFLVPAANFFQQQLQQQKVARASVKLIFAGS